MLLSRESVLKIDHELSVSQPPVTHRQSPLLGDLCHAHINDLPDRVVSWENRLGFGEFPHHSMVAFDGIRRIYYLPNFLRIFEKYGQFSPVFIPGFQDIRVFLIPLLSEFFLGKFSVIEVHSAVDFLQVSTNCLAVFVRHKLTAVAYLVDYTELIFRLRENRIYRITKPREVIMAGNRLS